MWVPSSSKVQKEATLPISVAITPFARISSNKLGAVVSGGGGKESSTSSFSATPRHPWESIASTQGDSVDVLGGVEGEESPPCIDFGPEGPVRCSRCGGYVNPWVAWSDGGAQWTCNLCGQENTAPERYACPLDANGARRDRDQRPELLKGSVDFCAPSPMFDSENTKPTPLTYVMCIDVGAVAIASGLTATAFACAREAINALGPLAEASAALAATQLPRFQSLPKPGFLAPGAQAAGSASFHGAFSQAPPAAPPQSSFSTHTQEPSAAAASAVHGPRMAIVTFDNTVHFWGILESTGAPFCAIVPDNEDSFAPLARNQWVLPLHSLSARDRVKSLISDLEQRFLQPNSTASRGWQPRPSQSAIGAAIKSCVDGLSGCGGRVATFVGAPCSVGEGALPPRESLRLYGVEKERELYTPLSENAAGAWWRELAMASVARGVCCDIFSASTASICTATMGQVSNSTGGEIRLYPLASATSGSSPTPSVSPPSGVPPLGGKLLEDTRGLLLAEFKEALSREMAHDSVFRLRTSRGLSVSKYTGNLFVNENGDAEFAGLDSQKGFVAELVSFFIFQRI